MGRKLITLITTFAFFLNSAGLGYPSSITLTKEDALRPAATAILTKKSIHPLSEKGPLDGLTILRFSHAYDGGCGVSEHLRLLNKVLLQRNKVTIIQMYITDKKSSSEIYTEQVGKGTLIKVPILLQPEKEKAAKGIRRYQRIYNIMQNWLSKMKLLGFIQDNLFNTWFSVFLRMVPIAKEYYNRILNANGVKEKAREILEQEGVFKHYKVDIAITDSLFLQDSLLFAGEVKRAGLAQNRNIPILAHHHGSNNFLYNIAFKEQIQIADRIATVYAAGIPPYARPKHALLRYGIDTDFYSPDKAKPLNLGFSEPVILLPARVSPRKGCFDIIHIVSKVLANGNIKRIKLIFAGSIEAPIFKQKILRLAEKYGIRDDIIFAGSLSQERLRDYYAMSDIVVLPSENEGSPRVLLEAQAMEKPGVAYNVGGVPETLLDSKTGYFVNRGNIDKFATRLIDLLSDKDKRELMGKAGRKFVEENYSLSALAARHEDCYLKVLRSRGLPSIYNKRLGEPGFTPGRIVAVILSPFALLAITILAVAIKITSRGPALFPQIRVGHKGRPIKILKLRTMTTETDPAKRKTTAIGKFLRVFRLDELPQLFSIIKGDMQWIGPRPLLGWQVSETYENTILSITWPGIFSSSVLSRIIRSAYMEPAMETIEEDWRDIENSSFLYNSRLILKTFFIFFQVEFRMHSNRGRNPDKDKTTNPAVSNCRQAESIPRTNLTATTASARKKTETIADALSANSNEDTAPNLQKSKVHLESPEAIPMDILKLKVNIAIDAAA